VADYSIDINASNNQIVGQLNIVAIKALTGIDFPVAEVHMYAGAIRHIKKWHPGIIELYGHLIPDMIANPDYVGQNPSEPNSVELVKVVSQHVQLAIKLDPSGYLFVSSFYNLDNGEFKVNKRLLSGRLVPYRT
jgi:hypothetical protein